MTTEETKAFVRRHFEDFVNQQDLTAADRISQTIYEEQMSDRLTLSCHRASLWYCPLWRPMIFSYAASVAVEAAAAVHCYAMAVVGRGVVDRRISPPQSTSPVTPVPFQ